MHKDIEQNQAEIPARRRYEAPKLTEIGSVAQLTKDPQVRPREDPPPSTMGGIEVFFLGDNA